MNREIQDWPSRRFCGGKLKLSKKILDRLALRQLPSWLQSCLFVDMGRGAMQKYAMSLQNQLEAQLVYRIVLQVLEAGVKQADVGVISFYSAQVGCIRALLRNTAGKDVLVHTVDGFQGGEREVIIVSFVRTGEGGIGFLGDGRRLNVGLMRAKRALIVLGSYQGLLNASQKSPAGRDMHSFLTDMRSRGLVQGPQRLEGWLALTPHKLRQLVQAPPPDEDFPLLAGLEREEVPPSSSLKRDELPLPSNLKCEELPLLSSLEREECSLPDYARERGSISDLGREQGSPPFLEREDGSSSFLKLEDLFISGKRKEVLSKTKCLFHTLS